MERGERIALVIFGMLVYTGILFTGLKIAEVLTWRWVFITMPVTLPSVFILVILLIDKISGN